MLQDVVIEKPAIQRTEVLGLSIRKNPTISVSGESRALWENDLVQPHNDISERDQRNIEEKPLISSGRRSANAIKNRFLT
jgi:hypothetical protein